MNTFRLKQMITVLVLGLFLISLSFAGSKKPGWVKQRPVSQEYYIGISVIPKSEDNKDFMQCAKDDALRDLSSEIMVNISSEFIHSIVEQSGMVEEEVLSNVRSTTKADLEGYELVGTWQDENDYWVYYRLSKTLYENQKKLKLKKATSLSLDMFSNAKKNEKENKIAQALMFYLQSLKPIQKYIAEPLQVDYNGAKIFLMNEIYSSIQYTLSQIELKALQGTRNAKTGQPLKPPLEVLAVFSAKSGAQINVSQLPLKFSFMRGSGDLVEKVKTGNDGKARCQVSKITATDRIQMVKAELDVFSSIQEGASVILQNIVKNFTTPSAKFVLNVSGLSTFLEVSEIHFDKKPELLYIEPKLKNLMSERGFTFIKDMANADIVINLKAASRKGAEMHGLFSAYVDLNISVLDMATGDEIYKNSLNDIKGIQLDYNKAGIKAFEEAGKKIEQILPELIKKIQK